MSQSSPIFRPLLLGSWRLGLICLLLAMYPCQIYAEEASEEDIDNKVEAEEKPEAVSYADLPNCVEVDGTWYWGSEDPRFAIQSRSNTSITVETSIGAIRVKQGLLKEDSEKFRAALKQLCELGSKADLSASDKTFLYNDSNITGPRLTRSSHIIIKTGVLAKQEVESKALDKKLNVIQEKAAAFKQHLSQNKTFDRLGRSAIENVIDRLHWRDEEEKQFDAVPPSFARRVVRHGWLSDIAGKDPSIKALETAVIDADSFALLRQYKDSKNNLRLLSNAFGDRIWILETPEATVYTSDAPKPMYHYFGDSFKKRVQLIVKLKPGINPLDPDAKLNDCSHLILEDKSSREVIAQWDGSKSEDAFTSNPNRWRSYLRKTRDYYVKDYVPPHITQVTPYGDVVKIVTPHGTLDALQQIDQSSMETFLKQAAEVLPTPGYLDLIGQYMLTYVYDSPDSSIPHLIGTSDNSSDIHQTTFQTLGTSCGGQFRGDCDDLSELYHNILSRQKKIPHVVSLPAHAAVGWAEEHDGQWHTYILQTGPALEFTADTLQKSLEKAYKHFDENDTFDPNGLGLLLRFSGENTRSGWRLSYRIFKEADYAKTMIDVQRDWHFQTYQRAVKKMLKMIEDGDEDTANFRELSGLYSFTGQYKKAAEYHKMAIDRTSEATSRLYMGMEYVQHLFESEQNEKAIAHARQIFDTDLPSLRKELSQGAQLSFALQMAGSLLHPGAYDLALAYMDTYATPVVDENLGQIINWINSNRYNEEAWYGARDLRQLRRIIKWYVNTAISLVQERGYDDLEKAPTLQKHLELVDKWITHIAPLEQEEPHDVMGTYSIIGNYYLISRNINSLIKDIDEANFPSNNNYNHRLRLPGLPQYNRDLPWIKLSVPFWFVQIAHEFDRENKEIDTALVLKCAERAEAAFAQAQTLNIAASFTRKQIHYVRVIKALLNQDADAMRELLKYVKTKNDKRLRDDTAQWIGDCARALDLNWYAKVIDIWTEELDYKPKYYWIAWRAALNHAPQHALLVAERAAKRFKDDKAFVEEYEGMKALFGAKDAE